MKVKLLASVLLASANWGVCQAQTSAGVDEAATGLGDIIVTAQRRKERLQETPSSISAFDQRQLKAFDVNNSRDLVGVVPNLYQGRVSTAPSTQTYGMRGLGQTDTLGDPTVAVYMDDIYLPRALGILFDVPGLERIEVLRGPQGTLYGRNATAGAIRYIIAEPDEKTRVEASAAVGNYDQLELSSLVSGKLAENLFLSVAAIHRERDGYTYDENTNRWLNDLNSTAGRITLRATPTDRFEVKLTFDGVYDNSDTTVYVPNTPPVGEVHDPYVTYEGGALFYRKGGRPKSKLTELGAALTAKYAVSDDISLKFISAYRGFGGPFDNEVDGLPAPNATYIKYREREHTDELQLTGTLGRLKWTSGLFYFYESYKLDPIINAVGATRTYALPDLTTNSYAIYGQFDYDLTDHLSVTAGGRYSYERRKFTNSSYRLTAQLTQSTLIYTAGGSKHYSSFDPKLGIQYKFNRDLMAYASYARGFQAGGFSLRAASATIAQAPYDPQTVDSYEGGIKADWLDGHLRTNFSYFYNKVKDFQATAFDPRINTSRVLNAGAAVTKGFEAEIATTPFDGLQLSGSLGHTASHYTRFDNPFGAGTTGVDKHLVFAPRWVGSVSAYYTLPLATAGSIQMGAQLQYTSRTFIDIVNTPNAEAPPQTFVNANISYTLPDDHWKIKLSATNLFDVAYRQFTFTVPGVSGSSYNPPRMVLFQVSYSY